MNKLLKSIFFLTILLSPLSAIAFEQATSGIVGTGTNCPSAALAPCFIANGANPVSASGQYALTVASSTNLTIPSPSKITGCFVSVENNSTYNSSVNVTFDGSTPTASQGLTLAPGNIYWMAAPLCNAAKFIQVQASGALDVNYVQ